MAEAADLLEPEQLQLWDLQRVLLWLEDVASRHGEDYGYYQPQFKHANVTGVTMIKTMDMEARLRKIGISSLVHVQVRPSCFTYVMVKDGSIYNS